MGDTFVAYVFFDDECDWEVEVTTDPRRFDAYPNVRLGGGINSLKDLWRILDANGFDYEYFCLYVEHDLSHRLYNLLNTN